MELTPDVDIIAKRGFYPELCRVIFTHKLPLFAIFCALLTFLTFWPALHYEFVNWDDDHYILKNTHLREDFFSAILWAIKDGQYAGLWMPVTWFSHAFDYLVWGDNPLGHHLTSIVLHSLSAGMCVLLFYEVIRLYSVRSGITDSPPSLQNNPDWRLFAAVLGALVFSLHPLRVESVAWISDRKGILCGFFYIIALFTYVKDLTGRDEGSCRRGWYYCSILFFSLSVAAKPMAVSFPVALIALDFAFRRFSDKSTRFHTIIEKIPFILIALVVSVLTIYFNWAIKSLHPSGDIPVAKKIALSLKGYVFYANKTIWPTELSTYYPINMLGDGTFPLTEALLLVGVGAIVLVFGRRHPYLPATFFFYLITLLPVIGVVKVGHPIFAADRFSYIPALAPSLLLGILPVYTLDRWCPRWPVYLLSAIVILLLVFCTRGVLPAWENTITLWTRAAESPHHSSETIFLRRGFEYYTLREYEKALADFDRARKFNPDSTETFLWSAKAYAETGRYLPAVRDLKLFLAKNPQNKDALNTLGGVFWLLGRTDEAIEQYRTALLVAPTDKMTYSNLTMLYKAQANFEELCLLVKKGTLNGAISAEDVRMDPDLSRALRQGCD